MDINLVNVLDISSGPAKYLVDVRKEILAGRGGYFTTAHITFNITVPSAKTSK